MTNLDELQGQRGVKLRPVVQVTFQQRGTAEQAIDAKKMTPVDAIQLDSTMLDITGRVDSSTDGTRTGKIATIDITNLPSDVAKDIDPMGFVRIEGGYHGNLHVGPNDFRKQAEVLETVFYGKIRWMAPHRQGPETVWRFSAASAAPRAKDIPVSLTFENRTYGEMMERIVDYIGGEINVPPSALGQVDEIPKQFVTKEKHEARDSVVKELEKLTTELQHKTGNEYRLVESNENPLRWELIDVREKKEVEFVKLDFNEATVYSANIRPDENEIDSLEFAKQADKIEHDEDLENEMQRHTELTQSFRYQASVKFDPRYEIGGWVKVIDPQGIDGIVNLDSVLHQLGGGQWRTQFEGKIVKSDELIDFLNVTDSLEKNKQGQLPF